MYWKGIFKCPQDHDRTVRLIPGSYEQEVSYDDETVEKEVFEYYIFREHYKKMDNNRGIGAICHAGPLYKNKKEAGECPGCDIFWQDVRERREKRNRGDKTKGPNRISLRDQYAFTVWDYGLWLKIPDTDGKGNVRTDKDGKPYTSWVMARSDDQRQHQYEHKWGNLLAWPMGETYKDSILQYNDRAVSCDCASCGTQGSIQVTSKICGNPNCEYPVYDPSETVLSPEKLESLENAPFECPACKKASFVNEMISCAVCEQNGLQPRRASVFDIDLQVTSVKAGNGNQTILQILNRSQPRPLQVPEESLAAIQPLDLIKKFASTTPDRMRTMWHLESEPQAPEQQAAAPHEQQNQQTPQAPVTGAEAPAAGAPAPGMLNQPAGAPPSMPTMGGGGMSMPGVPGFNNNQ